MSATVEQLRQRLAEVRTTFDESYARPVRREAVETEDLLAIRVGDQPYAVRLRAVAGLAADPVVTPLPDAPPELLGVAGVRRAVVAVYDLAALLDRERSKAPRWLILTRSEPVVGLAFDAVDGHLRVPRTAIAGAGDGQRGPAGAGDGRRGPAGAGDGRRGPAGDVIETPAGTRAVVDIPAVHAALVSAARSVARGRTP